MSDLVPAPVPSGDGPPTSPRALTPEARDALILAAVEWLVAREQARGDDRSYLRSLAESRVLDRIRLDQLAALVVLAALAGGLGVSGSSLWAMVTGVP